MSGSPPDVPQLVKIMVAGGFGVGKTTFIGSVSEIAPAYTEEVLTRAGAVVDDLAGIEDKTTTTVASDFGRRTLAGSLVLYLFGAPGQQRFRSLWTDTAHGAAGAMVLVDTRARRLAASFEAFDAVEESGLPYVVAVNRFPDSVPLPEHVLREHLDLAAATPLVACDARDEGSTLRALIALTSHLIATAQAGIRP
ncbi:ATP-binding protein [Kitasatospora sp. NE20-6]